MKTTILLTLSFTAILATIQLLGGPASAVRSILELLPI